MLQPQPGGEMSDAAELPSVADATPEIRLGIDVVLAPEISFAAHQ
jgi:hypothetical protein